MKALLRTPHGGGPSTNSIPSKMKTILNTRLAKGASLLAISALFGASQAHAQTMEYFGDWVQSGTHVEYYVARAGAGAVPVGYPAYTTITGALAQAVTDGNLGVVPVTINVLAAPGSYNAFIGEVFPIQLPAHGVSIEAYDVSTVNGAPVVLGGNFGGGAQELFLYNSIGNDELPPSVLRGLELRNNSGATNAAEVRVDITLGAPFYGDRIPVEIRDCVIRGAADIGVDLVGDEIASMEVVLERNVIEGASSGPNSADIGVRVSGDEGPCAPIIRSNDIRSFPLNVQIAGGGESNQTRLQSNFIQVGQTNVQIADCAPWIFSNTIAFAFDLGGNAVGLDMGMVTDYTLSHNLIWNPDHGGMNYDPLDVVGLTPPIGPPSSGFRFNWYNLDEDDLIFSTGFAGYTLVSGGIGGTGFQPDFVGGDFGAGAMVTDLHLNTTSALIDQGIYPEFFNDRTLWEAENDVPGAGWTIYIRTDHAHDRDFDPRIAGMGPEIGADEVLAEFSADSPTRAAKLSFDPDASNAADIDAIGNLRPSAAGNWDATILFQGNLPAGGTPDTVTLIVGFGFMDRELATLTPWIENRSLLQNHMFYTTNTPGMSNFTSYSLDLGSGSIILPSQPLDAAGQATWPLSLGPALAGLVEGEVFLQALVVDPTAQFMQASNRLSVDLNR